MNKLIITDIDECVLEWRPSFIDYVIKNGYPTKGEYNHFNIEEWLDIPSEEIDELLTEFNSSEMFGNLNVGYKSNIFIPLLHEMGYEFIALTSCGSIPEISDKRKDNIKSIFGDVFKDIICIDFGVSKDDYLKELPHDSIWVEDRIINSKYGLKYNHKCFLIDQIHNQNCDDKLISRVNDWEEIYDCLV